MNYKKIINEKIQKILMKKKINDYNVFLFEIYINIYLILEKKREIAQVYMYKEYIEIIIKLLNKYYPFYKIYEEERLILYHPKYNIDNLNETFTKKFALQLGKFYKCAGDVDKIFKTHKYLLRPVIRVKYMNINFELFAQMCPPSICVKNLDFFVKIAQNFDKILKKINKDILAGTPLKKIFIKD